MCASAYMFKDAVLCIVDSLGLMACVFVCQLQIIMQRLDIPSATAQTGASIHKPFLERETNKKEQGIMSKRSKGCLCLYPLLFALCNIYVVASLAPSLSNPHTMTNQPDPPMLLKCQ